MEKLTHQHLRLFIAILFPDSVVSALEKARTAMQRQLGHASVSWVQRSNFHLSLVFLGDQHESRLPELWDIMNQSASAIKTFSFIIQGTGFFGKHDSPRVLWAGIRADAQLSKLQAMLAEKLSEAGFSFDHKPFSPHVTLGRVRRWPHTMRCEGVVSSDTTLGTVNVSVINLMQSSLRPEGAIYESLHEAPLQP